MLTLWSSSELVHTKVLSEPPNSRALCANNLHEGLLRHTRLITHCDDITTHSVGPSANMSAN